MGNVDSVVSVRVTTITSAFFLAYLLNIHPFVVFALHQGRGNFVLQFRDLSNYLIALFMNIMRCDFCVYILKLELPMCPSSYRSNATN